MADLQPSAWVGCGCLWGANASEFWECSTSRFLLDMLSCHAALDSCQQQYCRAMKKVGAAWT